MKCSRRGGGSRNTIIHCEDAARRGGGKRDFTEAERKNRKIKIDTRLLTIFSSSSITTAMPW